MLLSQEDKRVIWQRVQIKSFSAKEISTCFSLNFKILVTLVTCDKAMLARFNNDSLNIIEHI